ncbi:hypothetical protein KIL84_016018 [Mauremys mutica]|uniref:Uncharacterized protein n=1 Tax=Mauremys mutica TaxID=74926 RepID=A0A9D4ASG1_9SAUR|nr:hypothetical protein KIL84_016018 [Mauremys mutica]
MLAMLRCPGTSAGPFEQGRFTAAAEREGWSMEATGWKRAEEPAQLLGRCSWTGRTETETLWPPAQMLPLPQDGRSLPVLAMAELPPCSKETIKTYQAHVMSMH